MRRLVAVVLLFLGCGAPEPALEPAPAPAPATPATPPIAQPTADERRDAEALAARFVASFDQVEQAYARGGKLDDAPLQPIVAGVPQGGCWAYSGERAFEAEFAAEKRPWSTVPGVGGGPPDVTFTLSAQRLQVGIYRAPRAGVVLFRVLRDLLVSETRLDDDVAQQVYGIVTAGVIVPDARIDELLRPDPTPDERRDAEALAERFAAAFDQVEQAFARGEMDTAPLDAVRGADLGPVWAMSGTDAVETPRKPGQPESVAWCSVLGILGGTPPDVVLALERHRLEVGVYRTDAAGPFVRPAGIVLLRIMKHVPGQQVHEVATAGVHISNARTQELLRDR